MKYSIIIGTLNHLEDCLKPCCEAIKKYTDLSNVEVIIVANGCTDGTKEYVESLGKPFKLLWFDKPLGYAKANNEGLKIAKGDFIVLLNNDAILLDQPKNLWLDMLEQPFKDDPKMGITGPIHGFSDPAGRKFIIFFCAMIKREVFDKIGLLDESFGVGGGEDTAFSIEAELAGYKLAQVPPGETTTEGDGLIHGGFKIYHKGEATVHDKSLVPDWPKIFLENSLKLAKKYNPEWYKWKISNNSERGIFGKDDSVDGYPREKARYTYAANNLFGKKVLEFGCSSGYALKFLPKDIDYTGVDYDEKTIEFAKENFGREGVKFICADIHKFEFKEHYDTIIAYEFIEHLEDGKFLAQKLKLHCDKLILTVPYMESSSAPWGPHHKLHELSPMDFPAFKYQYILEDGQITNKVAQPGGQNLLLLEWINGEKYLPPSKPNPRVLCSIPTKDRYDVLSNCVQSVLMQTVLPDKIVIFDDGGQKDLREDPVFKHIFNLFEHKKVLWEVVFTPKKGQHFAHSIANASSDFDYIWRIDDDEIAEPNVLEKLLSHMTPEVGAVGGAVFIPGQEGGGGTGKMKDFFNTNNVQWSPDGKVYEVDHLHSSFLYRPRIAQYNLELSPVAHREETLFSMELRQKGYKLIVDNSAKTYHFRQEKGGIRSHDSQFFYEHDDRIFVKKLEEWGYKIINLNSGLGDHLVFLTILPDLLKKYKYLYIGCCYPEVFKDYKDQVTLLPVAITEKYGPQNVYKWMIDNNWSQSMLEAYKRMYGV